MPLLSSKALERSASQRSSLEHCWQDNTFGIGYLDAGHGHDFGLSEVALTNAAGNTRTSLESIRLGGVADAGTAGANNNVFPADPAADFSGSLALRLLF